MVYTSLGAVQDDRERTRSIQNLGARCQGTRVPGRLEARGALPGTKGFQRIPEASSTVQARPVPRGFRTDPRYASSRRKCNLVRGLYNCHDQSRWMSGIYEMLNMLGEYFDELFTSTSPLNVSPIIDKVQARISEAMNETLLQPFRSDEIKTVVDGLSVILNDANGTRAVTRARIGRERLEVSHLFFADDSIIFCEASLGGDANLQAALMEYSISSGQQVNYDKSLIFFSGNVDIGLQNQIGRMLGV
ncbi:hypothetical protein V6N13_080386 [Hibiscus sabdariffa]